MTYCIGWLTETAAFLISDSVVTYPSEKTRHHQYADTTAFGERQGKINQDEKFSFEDALKIHVTGEIAITFSGDQDFGIKFIDLFIENILFGNNIEKALANSHNNFIGNQTPNLKVLIAAYENKPAIYSFDNKRDILVKKENNIITIGEGNNMEEIGSYIRGFHKSFLDPKAKENQSVKRDEILLVKMLALSQAYGIHNYTIDHGFGGTYTGLYINKNSINWQPNLCYSITGENLAFDDQFLTGVIIKDNYLCIINSKTQNIVFPDFISRQYKNNKDLSKAIRNTFDKALLDFDKANFQYMTFINTSRQTTVIVNMNGEHHHMYIYIDIQDKKPGTIGMVIDKELERIVNDDYEEITTPIDTSVHYIPYIPINPKKLTYISKTLRNLRLSKIEEKSSGKYRGIIYDKEGKIKDSYFLSKVEDTFPFLKTFINEDKIYIINRETDLVELEFEDKKIIFPKIEEKEQAEIMYNIKAKPNKKNYYLFDLLFTNESDEEIEQITIYVLSTDWTLATEKARLQIETELTTHFQLTPVGIQFYYPS